ncbi:hypothetical protein BC936DRAFT_143605 [Jimgerdemannia flammicorona]|uniref:Uncharacterized protein n=1 Tax=Jimgerdemannia flammicorona TaxID=994334 RepID=A0A433DDP2_9FUNG|nr:hypothetical protein BC936DRAFT_143605 [Jimgerdemannia flammicorona]
MCLEISQAHEECEHELRAEIQCLKQDVREKDEEINRQKVEIEDLIAQLEERKFVSEEQDKVIDHFLSGNFFQGASGEVKLNMYE